MPHKFAQLYKQLNPRQRQAVEAIEGPVMVLAGPGTGKTQVLTMRLAHILRATQMDPWNILCLTFTESAVAAMRTRLISIIGPTAYQVWIHTFHSFCNEIMQEYPEKFSAARDWQVLSDVERIDTFVQIIDDLPGVSPLKPFGNPYLYLRDVMSNIQALKQENISPRSFSLTLKQRAQFIKEIAPALIAFAALAAKERTAGSCQAISDQVKLAPGAPIYASDQNQTKYKNDLKRWYGQLVSQLPKQQTLARIYRAYQKALAAAGRYDFEDMISMVVARLKTDDQLLARYQEQFQYVLVDEYQDSNGAQNEVVRLLGSWDDQPNIFVVGDDKQSIYRFQGASLTNLLSFYETYKKYTKIVSLQANYRSTQTILDAAAVVIAHNRESLTKYIGDTGVRLTAHIKAKKQSPLVIQAFSSEEAEDSWVTRRCQALIAQGVDPGDIAVLYRVNQDGVDLLPMMRRLGVPARLEVGGNVLNDRRIGQWLNLLGYLNNIHRDDLLAEILHYPWWNIESLDVLRVIHYVGHTHHYLLTVITSAAELSKAGVAKPESFMRVAKLLADWRAAAADTTLQNFLNQVLVESGWLDYMLRANGDAGAEAVHRLNALLNEAKLLNQGNPHFSLADFMRHLRILREHNLPLTAAPWQADTKAVHLMTAHRAKGQEFTYVFVTRLVDRHWGNRREWNRAPLPQGLVRQDFIAGQENNEDERRLFYVALTRARQQLYLTYATHNLAGRQQVPAVFLAELPETLVIKEAGVASDQPAAARLAQAVLPPLPIYSNASVKGWLTRLLASYVMSVTHLNNYLACPRLFYFRNLLRVPEAPTIHQAFGSAVHRALRDWLEKASPPQYLLDRFDHHLKREILTAAQLKEGLAQGRKVLSAYVATLPKQPIMPIQLEYDFTYHGAQLDGIPLTGKLDKIEILDPAKKQVNVVDFKTGNPDRAWAYLKPGGKYHRQLVFYKLLTQLSPRFEYEMASGEIDFIQPSSRTGQHVTKKIAVTDADLKELKSTIKKTWEEIQSLRFLDENSGCGECQFCRAV